MKGLTYNMKKKNIIFTTFLSTVSLATSILVFFKNSNIVRSSVLAENPECAYHHGYHYQAKSPTIDETGHQEFWACCTCGHQYLEQPDGSFTDRDDSLMTGSITSTHVAYLPPLTKGGSNGDYWSNDLIDDTAKIKKTRVIVMAGQSNAAGVGRYEYLASSVTSDKLTEINNGYQNVLMTGFCHGDLPNYTPVSANETSSTVGITGTYGFEIGLAERLSKTFPDETIYLVKYAFGATSLNYDWISPSVRNSTAIDGTYDSNRSRGWLFDGMCDAIERTVNHIEETTDTEASIEAFMWMQGENDAAFETATSLYPKTFEAFVTDFKSIFSSHLSDKFAIYDAGIAISGQWPNAVQMNNYKSSRADENNIYIDTNAVLTTEYEPAGSDVDVAHYDATCNIELGHLFADAYLERVISNYSHNVLEIQAPNKIAMTNGVNYIVTSPTVTFNGQPVNAKITYYAKQHKISENNIVSYFTVNGSTFTPTSTGNSSLRIAAYYNDEVRTVVVPVEIK